VTPRAELLAFRRAVVARAATRRPPKRLPQALPPKGPLVAYTRALLDLSDEMDAAILEALAAEGLVPRADAAEGDVPSFSVAERRSVAARVEAVVRRVLARRPLLARLQEVADATARASRTEWARQMKAALGIDLPDAEPALAPAFKAFRAENVDLITSLAADKVARVREILTDAGAGTRVEEIARAVREGTDATRSRARLIARDQVLKLNAQVTQARHEAAGVTEFVWRTSKDERVREDHKILDGKRFRYDDPPVVDRRRGDRALPGVHFQCRCIAEPVIPGFDDA
jgi:SPP1 gp7 family putative phage head morphogenesis protein